MPLALARVELSIHHDAAESGVLGHVEDLVDMVKVCAQLSEVGVVCRPRPVLVNLGNREFVLGDLGVDACARVAVPSPSVARQERKRGKRLMEKTVPSATKAVTGLIYDRLVAKLAQLVQEVNSSETGAYDEDVCLEVVGIRSLIAGAVCILAQLLLDRTDHFEGV